MRHLAISGTIALLLIAVGCASQPAAAPPTPAASAAPALDYSQIKAAYLKANPDARVGRVAAVMRDKSIAAIDDVAITDFAPGDDFVIVDNNLNVVADATVTDAGTDLLFVRYSSPTSGGRDPVVGDLAILPAPK